MDYSNWTVYKRGVISKRSPHVDLGEVRARELFAHFPSGAYIRYISDFDKAKDDIFYYVIKDGEFSMETIPSKTRNMVRRCLKSLSIQHTDAQNIINRGGITSYCPSIEDFPARALPQKCGTRSNGRKV